MSYTETFIQVAEDCPVGEAVVPISNRDKKPIHLIQYELLSGNPYALTEEDVIFQVYIQRSGITGEELASRGEVIREELFQKPHPCFRASALPKRYGWGLHYDEQGKIALYPMESNEYQAFAHPDSGLKQLRAMRSKRK